jgi:hypothetical protein
MAAIAEDRSSGRRGCEDTEVLKEDEDAICS